jgi:hypothetical protein
MSKNHSPFLLLLIMITAFILNSCSSDQFMVNSRLKKVRVKTNSPVTASKKSNPTREYCNLDTGTKEFKLFSIPEFHFTAFSFRLEISPSLLFLKKKLTSKKVTPLEKYGFVTSMANVKDKCNSLADKSACAQSGFLSKGKGGFGVAAFVVAALGWILELINPIFLILTILFEIAALFLAFAGIGLKQSKFDMVMSFLGLLLVLLFLLAFIIAVTT